MSESNECSTFELISLDGDLKFEIAIYRDPGDGGGLPFRVALEGNRAACSASGGMTASCLKWFSESAASGQRTLELGDGGGLFLVCIDGGMDPCIVRGVVGYPICQWGYQENSLLDAYSMSLTRVEFVMRVPGEQVREFVRNISELASKIEADDGCSRSREE